MLHFNSNYSQFNQANIKLNTKKAIEENEKTNQPPEAETTDVTNKKGYQDVVGVPGGGILITTRDYFNKKEARQGGLTNGDLVGINGKEYWYINGRFIKNKG